MKNFGVLITFLIFSVAMLAQESAAELKNAGNEALRNKNHAEAVTKYEAYFATGEEGVATDKATLYLLATSAYRAGMNDKAMKYYEESIAKDYKADLALYYISQMYKKQGNEDMEIETLKRVLSDYPRSKNFTKFQSYVVSKFNKDAAEPYNQANNIAMEAAASGDAGVYLNKMKSAIVLWDDAIAAFEKTLEVDPNNATALNAISNIKDQKKAYETYKASLNN